MAEGLGVLLYYVYVDLRADRCRVHAWMGALCERLGLRGRVRVALDGVNATLAGPAGALAEHQAAVEGHPLLGGGEPIDFKLAPLARTAASARVAEATAFDTLQVNTVKEVVSLGAPGPLQDLLRHRAPHLSPRAFHEELLAAPSQGRATVLVDARNLYETRIGRFQAEGVELLAPATRAFGDLRAWLDAQAPALAGRRVLMCCTGGVRCEGASAYLRAKGPAFQDVAQLQGGIQRYLEAFPGPNSLFRGSNFVFDERGAVPGGRPAPLGACAACAAPWGSYEARARCGRCRMLVLLCDACHRAEEGGAPQALVCELCLQRQASASAVEPPGDSCRQAPPVARRLRVLCLHGFRSNASRFRGKLCALTRQLMLTVTGQLVRAVTRKLRDLVEFTYVDGPHALPFYFKPQPEAQPAAAAAAAAAAAPGPQLDDAGGAPASPQQAADLGAAAAGCCQGRGEGGAACDCPSSSDPEQSAARADASREARGSSAFRALPPPGKAKWAWLVEPGGCSSPAAGPGSDERSTAAAGGPLPAEAWPGSAAEPQRQSAACTLGSGQPLGDPPAWATAPGGLDHEQYTRQTAGWAQSLAVLRRALEEQGPFDGVLGFSQGAGIAAVLCLLQQQQGQQQEGHRSGAAGRCPQPPPGPLRFAICCSGYPSVAPEHAALLAAVGPIALPSLHVYSRAAAGGQGGEGPEGLPGHDRQIGEEESARLAAAFSPEGRVVVAHAGGHHIPCSRACVARYRAFLQQQLQAFVAEGGGAGPQ